MKKLILLIIATTFYFTSIGFSEEKLDCTQFQKDLKNRMKCLTKGFTNKLTPIKKKIDEINENKTLSDLTK